MLEENLIYNPVDPNFFYYKGLDNLNYNFDNIIGANNSINDINICGYKINNLYAYPFIEFLLKKDIFQDCLTFPFLNKVEGNSNDIILKINSLMKFVYPNIELDDKYEYKGYFYYKNNLYLFYDFTNCEININCVYKNSHIWSVLVDEIINLKHVCNIRISPYVSDFFTYNIEFLFLKDEKNNSYETPIITYVGRENSMLNFTYVFGVSKDNNNGILGPYSYFTNFKNAIRQGGWSENEKPEKKYEKTITENEYGKYIKGGIVRFALFMKSMKVVLNYPEDPNDESIIKMEKIKDNYEKLTIRITDYDGIWAEKYDSIYVGKIELDNGEKMKNTPIYAIKKYEQQVPLSYHYIDKQYLKHKFYETIDYFIL